MGERSGEMGRRKNSKMRAEERRGVDRRKGGRGGEVEKKERSGVRLEREGE